MSNDLQRWADANRTSGLASRRQDKQQQAALQQLKRETAFAGALVDAEAALTGRIMERAVDIDHWRRALANGDEGLNSVLIQIELGFVAKAQVIQRGFGQEFGR